MPPQINSSNKKQVTFIFEVHAQTLKKPTKNSNPERICNKQAINLTKSVEEN